jgi:hypothetical protein
LRCLIRKEDRKNSDSQAAQQGTDGKSDDQGTPGPTWRQMRRGWRGRSIKHGGIRGQVGIRVYSRGPRRGGTSRCPRGCFSAKRAGGVFHSLRQAWHATTGARLDARDGCRHRKDPFVCVHLGVPEPGDQGFLGGGSFFGSVRVLPIGGGGRNVAQKRTAAVRTCSSGP